MRYASLLFGGFTTMAVINSPERKLAKRTSVYLSLVLLLISNLTNELRLHQFLLTKTIEANKSLKTDANGAC